MDLRVLDAEAGIRDWAGKDKLRDKGFMEILTITKTNLVEKKKKQGSGMV